MELVELAKTWRVWLTIRPDSQEWLLHGGDYFVDVVVDVVVVSTWTDCGFENMDCVVVEREKYRDYNEA